MTAQWSKFKFYLALIVSLSLYGCSSMPSTIHKENSSQKKPTPQVPEIRHAGQIPILCNINKIGSIRENTKIKSSSLIKGDCDYTNGKVAIGNVKGIWCVTENCLGYDANSIHSVPGKVVGIARNGQISGIAILLTDIGTFYGEISDNGDYKSGFLKINKTDGFLGEFNSDGTFKSGVSIKQLSPKSFSVIYAKEFKNNEPIGYAYSLNNSKYQIMKCNGNTCENYVRDKSNDDIYAALSIIQNTLIESLFFETPVKKLIFSTITKTEFTKNIERAYDFLSMAKTAEEVGGVFK